MRIRFIFTVFAAFLSLICSAQDEKTHKNMLFKAGINLSKLTDDDYYDHYSTRQGFNVGFEAQIQTSNPCVYSIDSCILSKAAMLKALVYTRWITSTYPYCLMSIYGKVWR